MKATLKNNGINTLSKVLSITGQGILITIKEGDFFLNYKSYPWFKNAKINEVLNIKRDQEAIYWDSLDVEIEIDSILNPQNYPLIAKH